MTGPLLVVSDLTVTYRRRGRENRVLDGVSLELEAGRTLGLVGESGSGKTTIGRAILGLAPIASGAVRLRGKDISRATRAERRGLASELQVIFQDPYSSLNPALTIEEILSEPLRAAGRAAAKTRVAELLDRVGLPSDSLRRLPSEFSGGQRQRIAIARALAMSPALIVCDEPTSALDTTTQERVLVLLKEIQAQTDVAYLFISHDLGVVREMSDRIAVLRGGEIVEEGDAEQVSLNPRHPYSRRLQLATPVPDPVAQRARRELRRAGLDTNRSD
ncbi:ABC transporter ATP-binding protein [Microbacterium sp. NPDC091313]